jgi:hypothetical protein
MLRTVIIDHHRPKIHEIALKMSHASAGSKVYLSFYDRAVKKIKAKLSEEKCAKYRAEAKSRNEGKLSESQQCRYVHLNFFGG